MLNRIRLRKNSSCIGHAPHENDGARTEHEGEGQADPAENHKHTFSVNV